MPIYQLNEDGSIRKKDKDGNYNGKPKKKNGQSQYRVIVNVTDANGKPKKIERKVYGLAEAKEMERQLEAEFKDKRIVPTARMTIQELFEKFEVYHANETRLSSHGKSTRNLRIHVLPTMADCKLDRLSKERLAEWKNGIAAKDLSIATKKGIYQAFNAMLNYAVKLDYLPKNPLSALGTFKDANRFEQSSKKLHYYTAEQFLDFLAVAKEKANTVEGWGYYVFFAIAFFTGARKGEIHALKWSDIEGNILHIRRSISQKLKGEDVETPPKTPSSVRDIQIPKPLLDILAEHKARQQEAAPIQFCEDFRICGGDRPLRDTSIENKNQAFAKAAGLPHIRIHDFRHPYVKYTTKNNCDNLMKFFVRAESIRRTSVKGTQSQSCYRGKRKPALLANPQAI